MEVKDDYFILIITVQEDGTISNILKRITDLDRFVQNLYDELCELEDFELNSSAPVFHIPPKEYDSVRQMMIPVGECYCILDGNNSRIFCKRKTISTINGLPDRIKEFNMIKNV